MKMNLSKIITLGLILSISSLIVSANYTFAPPISTFKVGFDFQIGNKKFSKGKYRLSKRDRFVLVLDNVTSGETKILIGSPSTRSEKSSGKSTLSFNRYGNQYFLRKVISPAVSAKVKLSKDEKHTRSEYHHKRARINIKGAK